MQPRALLDQGLPAEAARLLRHKGWEVLHVSEIGMHDASDADILSFARAAGRFCVTLDKDFHDVLANTSATAPSVVLVRGQGIRAHGLAELLIQVWARYQADLLGGNAVTVTDKAIRVRALPLRVA